MFYKRKLASLSAGTQQNYARHIRLHFQKILPIHIQKITPQCINVWLDTLRSEIGKSQKASLRIDFIHELSAMRCILRFCLEYYDDPEFRYPLKSRHAEDTFVRKAPPKVKALPKDEFILFRAQLLKQRHGSILAPMATVQYYQALRISEAAGLFLEDMKLNFQSPEESSIRVCRHVLFPRIKNAVPEISKGFRNASRGDRSVKELSLYPQAFDALKQVYQSGKKGLAFSPNGLIPFT